MVVIQIPQRPAELDRSRIEGAVQSLDWIGGCRWSSPKKIDDEVLIRIDKHRIDGDGIQAASWERSSRHIIGSCHLAKGECTQPIGVIPMDIGGHSGVAIDEGDFHFPHRCDPCHDRSRDGEAIRHHHTSQIHIARDEDRFDHQRCGTARESRPEGDVIGVGHYLDGEHTRRIGIVMGSGNLYSRGTDVKVQIGLRNRLPRGVQHLSTDRETIR